VLCPTTCHEITCKNRISGTFISLDETKYVLFCCLINRKYFHFWPPSSAWELLHCPIQEVCSPLSPPRLVPWSSRWRQFGIGPSVTGLFEYCRTIHICLRSMDSASVTVGVTNKTLPCSPPIPVYCHSLAGLPLRVVPSMMPNTTVFISLTLTSDSLQIWPKKLCFLSTYYFLFVSISFARLICYTSSHSGVVSIALHVTG